MLINETLANKKLATPYGEITFNEKGESKDLKGEQEKVLGNLPGFTIKNETKAPAKKAEPKEEEKVEAKAAPKKTAAKKN